MGTATGLTAARMQQIIDQQILAGAVDLSGQLIMTRADGSTFNAGTVKGATGDPAIYPVGGFPSSTVTNYVRLAVLDGLNTTNGASSQFILSGIGGIGYSRRGTVLVHAAQRNSNVIDLRAWSWGLDGLPAGQIRLFTRQTGEFLFEIWAALGTYNNNLSLMYLAGWRSTLTIDNKSDTQPTALVEISIERSDSPAATTALAGISELATAAEVQAGTDDVRTVTPAGLASVVGVGLGYRLRDRVIYTSSGSFAKASWPGLRAIRIIAVGGGGAGAGAAAASATMNAYGTGGGSGAYAETFMLTDSLAASTAVTVGAGGSATGSTGNNGSTSSFGSLVVAGGGIGGNIKATSTLGGYVPGGPGGVATAGQIRQGGSPGHAGAGANTLANGGNGGSSIFGGGGHAPATGAGSGANAGSPGTAYGAGGGGAAVNGGGGARSGGAGAAGVVIVEIYR